MPQVNPCTRVVDFVRSCFQGSWRFWRSRPDVITEGYHFFADDDAPAIKGPHSFGSGVWDKDKGKYPDNPLGQVMARGQTWYNGQAPILLPPSNQIGRTEDFAADLQYPPRQPVILRGSFDAQCWVLQHPGIDFDPQLFLKPDITDCCWQRVLARLLEWLNDDTPASTALFNQAAAMLWNLDFGIRVFPIPFSNGNAALIMGEKFQVVLLTGLQTWQELYGEVWHALAPPVDMGAWATSERWRDNATSLTSTLQFWGWNPAKATTFVGHSKGGVMSCIIALRALEPNPRTEFEILTFGIPKPGDRRFVLLPGVRAARHVVNVEDPIPNLPPFLIQRDFPAFIGELTGIHNIALWRQFSVYQIMREGQQPAMEPFPLFSWDRLLDLYNQFLVGDFPNPVQQHYLPSYVRRLQACCQAPVFPFSPELWRLLFNDPDNLGVRAVQMPAGKLGVETAFYYLGGSLALARSLGSVGDLRVSSPQITSAHLALTGPRLPYSDLALTGPQLPSSDLALTGPQLPSSDLALTGPQLPSSHLALTGPQLPSSDLALTGPQLPSSDLALTGPQLPSSDLALTGPQLPSTDLALKS